MDSVRRSLHASGAEVIASCPEWIAHLMPGRMAVVPVLPGSAAGKQLKRELRSQFTRPDAAVNR